MPDTNSAFHSIQDQIVDRLGTWTGVQVRRAGGSTFIYVRARPIARLFDGSSLEVVLCGPLKEKAQRDAERLHDLVAPVSSSVTVDLRQPKGVEESIRLLLNAYLTAQSHRAEEATLRIQDHRPAQAGPAGRAHGYHSWGSGEGGLQRMAQ